jgi:hypothetical protein
MGIILGILNLIQILDTSKYKNPISDLLLQFGNLFSQDIKLFAYPYKPYGQDKVYQSKTVELSEDVQFFYNYLLQNKLIVDIECKNKENLDTNSAELIEKIKRNEPQWEETVPRIVSSLIKEKCLFDYPCDIDTKRKKVNPQIFLTEKG